MSAISYGSPCGHTLVVRDEPSNDTDLTRFTVSRAVEHGGPMDESCRWVLEAFAEEQQKLLDVTVTRIEQSLRDHMGRRT